MRDGPRDAALGARSRLNLRRWLTPGIGVKRWLLVVFAGLRAARARRRPPHPPGDARPPAGRPRPGRSSTLVTLQFLPFPLRGLVVGRRRARAGRASARTASSGRSRSPFRPRRDAAARRADLPEAVPRPRAADRGDRRRDRAVDAPARAQGAHEQPHRGRGGRRRRRLVRRPPRGARDPAGRRHPALHRRAGRRRAADGRAPPVPLPGLAVGRDAGERRRARRPRGRQPPARGDDRDRGRRLRGGPSAR